MCCAPLSQDQGPMQACTALSSLLCQASSSIKSKIDLIECSPQTCRHHVMYKISALLHICRLAQLSLGDCGLIQVKLTNVQVAGWCQDMCLNRSRQRRRHRRSIEDWFHLSEHALVADSSPGFQAWLQSPSSAWHWPQDQEDTQVLHAPEHAKEATMVLLQPFSVQKST